MTPLECEFEAEVLAAAIQSRWPDRTDPQLRAHVAECRICSDVALVAAAIEESREHIEDIRDATTIPDSGRVWWLARMRARREAVRTAGRPITVAQVLAFACAMGLLGACFGATCLWFQDGLRETYGSLSASLGPALLSVMVEHEVLAAAVALLVLLVPAAVYLVVVRDS